MYVYIYEYVPLSVAVSDITALPPCKYFLFHPFPPCYHFLTSVDYLLNSPPTKSLPFVLPLSVFPSGYFLYCYHTSVFKKPYFLLKNPVLTFHCCRIKPKFTRVCGLYPVLDFPSLQSYQAVYCFLYFCFSCLSQCLEFLFFVI